MKLSNGGGIALAIVALCTLLAAGGCDGAKSDRVPISGVVMIDGQPLTYGTIRLLPIGEGRPAFSNIDPQGKFDFGAEGVKLGANRVEVIGLEQLGNTGYKQHAPHKYANAATSGLEENIQGANNNLVIQLTWGGEQPQIIRSSGGGDDTRG